MTTAVRFKKPRCHVETCRRDATRDTPLCGDHWRSIPEELRREFMAASHRVIDAAQTTEETS